MSMSAYICMTIFITISKWVILLNLVHTGYLQLLAVFNNLAGNEHGFLPKISTALINTPKQLRLFLILLDFPCFFLYI